MIFYTFTEKLHRELLLIDSLGTDTFPDEFPDWEDFERRVFSVKACLESSLGIDLDVDRMQDAYFSFSLALHKDVPGTDGQGLTSVLGVTFSNYGNLAIKMWPSFPDLAYTNKQTSAIEECLDKNGFIACLGDSLFSEHDGVHEFFKRTEDGSPGTWYDRFFRIE